MSGGNQVLHHVEGHDGLLNRRSVGWVTTSDDCGSGADRFLRQPELKEEGTISARDDLPWNGAPADGEAPIGGLEPGTAATEGEDGQKRDSVAVPLSGLYGRDRPDTLDEGLGEKEPDASLRQAPWAGELINPERVGVGGGGYRSEAGGTDDVDEPSAEEAAIRVRGQEAPWL